MLEKIGTKYYDKLSSPNRTFINYIKNHKQTISRITVAEIGVGIGATTQEALKILNSNDQYYLFDYMDKVEELSTDITSKLSSTAQIISMGNSRSKHDNYVWSLFSLVVNKDIGDKGVFDLVLLDGAHDFTIDLAACTLLIGLLKSNGFILLDDIDLNMKTIMDHNSLKVTEWEGIYSDTQVYAFQMKMICECFLDRQPNLQKITTDDSSIVVYRKC